MSYTQDYLQNRRSNGVVCNLFEVRSGARRGSRTRTLRSKYTITHGVTYNQHQFQPLAGLKFDVQIYDHVNTNPLFYRQPDLQHRA